MPGSGLERAYTPSLRLLQQEALILEESELGALNDDIRHCLRCGKCKPVCTTHVPRANLLYSPRNKILATGQLIEAFLYEEQTRRGLSLRHFDEFNDVADHCTVCHRCATPCPVNIDFGDVTVRMRQILAGRGRKRRSLGTALAMAYLNVTDPRTIALMRRNLAHRTARALRLIPRGRPAATTGKPKVAAQVIRFVDKPLPEHLPRQPMRRLLGLEDATQVPIYFPGCGSERLFSQIGLATLAMLYEVGAQTVLPPGYLCCGYPQNAAGDGERGRRITTDNRVLFHRVANTLNYLDIKTVVVSCVTYRFEAIFPGCRLLDIHEYLQDKGVRLEGVNGRPAPSPSPAPTSPPKCACARKKSSPKTSWPSPDAPAPKAKSNSSPAAPPASKASPATGKTPAWKPTTSSSNWPAPASAKTGKNAS